MKVRTPSVILNSQKFKATAVAALAVLMTSTQQKAQAAPGALNPLILQQITQRIVDKVVKDDDLVQSAEGRFVVDKTNLEQNIAAVQASATSKNLPWAAKVESKIMTEGSYRSVKRASRYGVEARARVTLSTPVLEAIRYSAREVNKGVDVDGDTYGAEAKAILVQLQSAPTLGEVTTLLKDLNQVARKALNNELAKEQATVANEEKNGGPYDRQSGREPTYCQLQAMEQPLGTDKEIFDFEAYSRCAARQKSKLNRLEMTKIVQGHTKIENPTGQEIAITITDAGGALEPLFEDIYGHGNQSVKKFENRKAMVIFSSGSITAETSAFVGLTKLDFDRIEKSFKDALYKLQSEDPGTTESLESSVKDTLAQVKRFIRNQDCSEDSGAAEK